MQEQNKKKRYTITNIRWEFHVTLFVLILLILTIELHFSHFNTIFAVFLFIHDRVKSQMSKNMKFSLKAAGEG